MSLGPKTFQEAGENFKPLARKSMKRGSAIKRRSPKPKKKKIKISTLKNRAWTEFSIFIRLRGADSEGMNRCVTCRVSKHWKQLQAGHFIAGRLNSNLFDERGCNPQCYSCNVGKHGNGVMYYKFMQRTHGEAVIDELIRQNDITQKWLPGQLESIRGKYAGLNKFNPLIDNGVEKV